MFEFNLKKHSKEELPTAIEAGNSAIEFATEIKNSWTKGKTYYKENGVEVNTFNTKSKSGDFWMARVSNHSDVSFEKFKKYILENHTENEVEYIPLLDSFRETDELENLENWRGIRVHYKFPKFFDDREMTVWICAIQPDENKNQFVIISLPADQPVSPGVTQGYYCSLEVVTYDEENECVEWLMAQASDAGGNIPRWIQNNSVTASVVDDVPHFIKWVKNKE